jgi:hypothetical protein
MSVPVKILEMATYNWLTVSEVLVHGLFALLPLGLWQGRTSWREHIID